MNRACIAIADAARARIFTYDHTREAAQQLTEIADLVNPARRQRPSELFSTTRPGRIAGPFPTGQTYDDHRDHHLAEYDARFARDIIVALDQAVQDGAYPHVIVVASPNMLGTLRKVDGVLHRDGLLLDEIPHDLAKLTSPQLHDRLADEGLIPHRERPGAHPPAR